ncbi:MAG: prepilin-type N-terminal cleavage/methylation domain-containing protein, partial [Nitrospirota bacterium]
PTHPSPSRGEGKGGGEKGFTLTELMIAIVIGMIVISATYATYISQQRSFTAQDQVAEMNSTSKIALDMIANDIRETGFGVPDDLTTVQRTVGCSGINGFTQKINLTDNTASEDQITILGGFRLVGNIASAVSSGSTTLTLTDTSELNTTDRAYISIAGLSFAIVTAIDSGTNTLTLQTGLDRDYPAGVPVYLIENVTYQIVNGELQKVRRLNGGGCATNPDTDTIAENIEDLQFALVDIAPADGVTDRIRVNLLATTARPDPNFQGQGNPPATIENRNLAATNDSLRRRWWQMEVDLRNPI